MNLTVHTLDWNNGSPIDQIISDNGIIIGLNSNGSSSASFTSAVPDGTAVTVQIFEPGFPVYDITIDNVYNEDKVIYLMMSPEVLDIAAADYKRPHPMFFYFQDPCSFKIDYYNASTQPGIISWYLNNELLEERNTKGSFEVCEPDLFQLKVRGQAFNTTAGACPVTSISWDRQWANTQVGSYVLPGFQTGSGETGNDTVGVIASLDTYLAEDTLSNIREVDYRPEINIDISTPTDQTDTCCYTQDEEVTLSASFVYNVGDETEYTYTWSVTDPEGLVVKYGQGDITFQITKLGTYTAELELTHLNCNNVFKKSVTLDTCDFIVFEVEDCGTYKMSNKSSNKEVTYSIRSIDNLETYEGELDPLSSIDLTFINPSIYIVTVIVTGMLDREYVLHNYCSLEDCLGDYIQGFICGTSCGDCPDDVELNRFLLLYYTYFLEINREYGTNNFYNGLTSSKLERLGDIKGVLDKILEYCSKRNCKSFSETPLKSTDCGCK